MAEIQTLVKTHLGSSANWDDSELSMLGSVFAMMPTEDLNAVENVKAYV